MRLRPLAALTAVAAALAVVPALAADKSVRATAGNQFTPKSVEIAVGEKVTWTNEGFHNVHFEDGVESPKEPSDTWTSVERRFDAAGTYGYFCEAHPSMTGTVVVKEATPTPTPTPTATPTPTPTPSPGASPTPTPAPSPGASPTPTPTPAPDLDDPRPPVGLIGPDYTVKPTAKRFCIRDCKRPGVFLRIDHEAGEALTFRGTLRRGKARFGTIRLRVPRGGKRVRILETTAGKRLRPGRYVLRLELLGGDDARKVRFRVIR